VKNQIRGGAGAEKRLSHGRHQYAMKTGQSTTSGTTRPLAKKVRESEGKKEVRKKGRRGKGRENHNRPTRKPGATSVGPAKRKEKEEKNPGGGEREKESEPPGRCEGIERLPEEKKRGGGHRKQGKS